MVNMEYLGEIEHLLFLIKDIKKNRHGANDPAIVYFKNLISLILKQDERDTIEFFEKVATTEDMEEISSYLDTVVYEFQSQKLLEVFERKVHLCKDSKYYNLILVNFEAAKKTMLIEKVSDWERYISRIYALDAIDLIEYLKTESDEKVLASIYGYIDKLTEKHMSQKLIDYMYSRLVDISDENEKKWMLGMLEDSKEILNKV